MPDHFDTITNAAIRRAIQDAEAAFDWEREARDFVRRRNRKRIERVAAGEPTSDEFPHRAA